MKHRITKGNTYNHIPIASDSLVVLSIMSGLYLEIVEKESTPDVIFSAIIWRVSYSLVTLQDHINNMENEIKKGLERGCQG